MSASEKTTNIGCAVIFLLVAVPLVVWYVRSWPNPEEENAKRSLREHYSEKRHGLLEYREKVIENDESLLLAKKYDVDVAVVIEATDLFFYSPEDDDELWNATNETQFAEIKTRIDQSTAPAILKMLTEKHQIPETTAASLLLDAWLLSPTGSEAYDEY